MAHSTYTEGYWTCKEDFFGMTLLTCSIKKILNILLMDNLTLVLQMKNTICEVHPKKMVPGPQGCAHDTVLPFGPLVPTLGCAHLNLPNI